MTWVWSPESLIGTARYGCVTITVTQILVEPGNYHSNTVPDYTTSSIVHTYTFSAYLLFYSGT